MLIIGTDPGLPAGEQGDLFARSFGELARAARAQVAASHDNDVAAAQAELTGEASVARDALVRSLGGGRFEVDPDLYASALSSDDGLVVLSGSDDDLNPPSVAEPVVSNLGTDSPALVEAALAAGELEPAPVPAALVAPAEPLEAPAPPAKKVAARKAPAAKKAPAKKSSTAKKAPAKKVAARKSTTAKK